MDEKPTNSSFSILSLYRADYSASLHVRAMAKLLAVSHVTLLPHCRWLEKSRILVSRRVGRNKEYLLNPNNFLTKYYILVAEQLVAIDYLEKNFLVKRLAEDLAGLNLTGALILFGSYAKDYATDVSDIDIFYLGHLSDERKEEIRRFGTVYGKEIHLAASTVRNFNEGLRSGDALVKEIMKNHVALQNPDPFLSILWRYYCER